MQNGEEADAAAAGPLAAAAAAAAAVAQHQAMLVQQQQRRAVAPGTQAAAGTGRDAEDTAACQEALQGQRKAAHTALTSGAFVLRLRSAVSYLPHPAKVSYGGEDAHFITDVGGGAIGVADGVGGWQESGVNPADYSRTFMHHACEYLEQRPLLLGSPAAGGPLSANGQLPDANGAGPTPVIIDPRGALDYAHRLTKVPGSSTAFVLQLDQKKNALVAANVGDSGFVLIRPDPNSSNGGCIWARSRPLQHYFDCPLQFGAYPEFVEATDTAEQADYYSTQVQPGDIIVAGTDGLWDNVFDNEIISTVTGERGVEEAAQALAALARKHASDPEFTSPYVREALSQGLDLPWWEKLAGATFKNWRFQLRQLSGGKQDDITVIVSKVIIQPAHESGEGKPQDEAGAMPAGSAGSAEDRTSAREVQVLVQSTVTLPVLECPPASSASQDAQQGHSVQDQLEGEAVRAPGTLAAQLSGPHPAAGAGAASGAGSSAAAGTGLPPAQQ